MKNEEYREVLIGLAIFAFVLIVEHTEVALIATLCNVMVVERLQDRAARLMGVGTIGETAVLGKLEYLTEITGQFLWLDIEGAEALDARGVDEPPALERYHLREGGGVLPRIVGIGDFGRPQVDARHKTVDEKTRTTGTR